MKKWILPVVFALVFCILVSAPVFAADSEEGFSGEYSRLIDAADLLNDSEESRILNELDEVSERQKFEIVIVTTDTLDGSTPRDYADDIYDYCGYGYGPQKDGILLLVSMEDRDWWISTCGYGITAFTDAGISYLSEQFLDKLSDGDYAAAFDIYIEQCDTFLTQARMDEPYDNSNLPRKPFGMIWIPISLVIGAVIALIIVGIMKSRMKTVRSQAAADHYVRKGSMHVTESRDLFLYRKVDRVARPKDQDSGSSTHTSSSGTTHGGGGGKF